MEKGIAFNDQVNTEEELRAVVGYPSEMVKNKVVTYLDSHCQDFLSKSPFLTISTSDQAGFSDVSPRGDNAGFVHVLNEKQLIIPERPGNRRSDTMLNILSNPKVGLLFFIPGLGETLRINGKACLVKDKELLGKMAVKDKKPLVGIVVEVEECFIHCAKAFIRSGLWNPDTWIEKEELPKAARILTAHLKAPTTDEQLIEADLKMSYAKGLY